MQVNSAIHGFVGNFMVALNPQITKSYASGDHKYMMSLIYKGARFSYYILLILSLPVIIYFYYADESFHNNLRFGFEGFFSLAEKGEWHVRSNKQLLSMVVWPDNFRTWLIGDGYFENPMNDFYYDGPLYNYYMGTDVGYCRFIFYFGLLGLVTFSAFFVVAAFLCTQNNPKYAIVFWLILLMNFIVWVKVSSDLFSVFALFLFVQEKNECYSNEVVE
jgi:hypothetical protein